jgi:prevent-host-death family protein
MQATAKDLRFHAKELLESVERGEEVVITYRGKPHVKLIPFKKEDKTFAEEENQLFGIWKDNDSVANVNDYVRNLRKRRFY